MRSIVSGQLRKDACHVAFYCCLTNVQLIRDVLIRITRSNQAVVSPLGAGLIRRHRRDPLVR